VLRAHPELVPGHLPNEHYRIDRLAEQHDACRHHDLCDLQVSSGLEPMLAACRCSRYESRNDSLHQASGRTRRADSSGAHQVWCDEAGDADGATKKAWKQCDDAYGPGQRPDANRVDVTPK
jgi:hypothetical protein